ncbi:hypothetical protein [Mycobacterium persicum]|uniref:hypothetical protein n=1 Tax=Mycobacterium persicum TaxID=1487726 RepID=UPI001604F1AD|nr:hypothetical protein [Mycobacterium persicum]
MGSSSRDDVVEVFDALDAELDRLCELSFEVLTTPSDCVPSSVWSARRGGCEPRSLR